jgi:hypothetical protein
MNTHQSNSNNNKNQWVSQRKNNNNQTYNINPINNQNNSSNNVPNNKYSVKFTQLESFAQELKQ